MPKIWDLSPPIQGNLTLASLSPSFLVILPHTDSLCSGHTDFLAIPQTHQLFLHLRAFAQAVPPPAMLSLQLTRSLLLIQRGLP